MRFLPLLFWSSLFAQNEAGSIEGRLAQENGQPIRFAVVLLTELGESTLTDAAGRFVLSDVPAGSHRLELSSGPNVARETVVVEPGRVAQIEVTVDWDVFFENVTVVSASRRRENILDAPTAITSVGADDISRRIGVGAVPELLEFTPGVELTQQDVGDFYFNTRGFNNTLTRRVAVFVDGRNMTTTFLGTPNWNSLPFPLEDYESVELVRGPSAALYGANASSGVLNVTSRSPRDSLGMTFRLTAGERDTLDGTARLAAELGGGWYMRLSGKARTWSTFAVSRHENVEYSRPCAPGAFGDCLPLDTFELEPDNSATDYSGSARFDKYFGNDGLLTLEGATSRPQCCRVLATGVGRFFLRGGGGFNFGRAQLDWKRFRLLAYINKIASPTTGGGGGDDEQLDEQQVHIEAQGDWEFDSGRWAVTAGGFYEKNNVDGFTPQPIDANRQAVYGQVDRELVPGLHFIAAARFEDGTVHDLQFSPRASLVWELRPSQTLRFTYNQAFQAPSLNEVFLEAPAAPPADLSELDGLCLANGFSCGLGLTPILAVGNPTLGVETVRSFEVGYRGLISNRTLITVDAFRSHNEDFITNLLPQLGTPFGRLNPEFGPWVGPPEAESTPFAFPGCPGAATVAECIRALAPPILSNTPGGASALVAVTHTNFGTVDTWGVELGASHALTRAWRLDSAVTWFDYELADQAPGSPDLLLPNAPPWQLAFGVSYSEGPWFASLRARWADAFRWSTGVFVGDVPSYTNADLDAHYQATPEWRVGLTVSNLFDDEHYQFFGAPILGRRARVHLTFSR